MISFIRRIWNDIIGDINAVRNWILSLIAAVYSFIRRSFDSLASEVVTVWRDLERFARQVDRYVTQVYDTLQGAITSVYDDIVMWVIKVYGELRNALDSTITTLNRWISDIGKALDKLYSDTIGWVIRNVWDPLYHDMLGVLNWIASEGKLVVYYITHPDALVSVLGSYLWASWLVLLRKYGKTIARWLAHSMIGLAGELVDLLESIMSAII